MPWHWPATRRAPVLSLSVTLALTVAGCSDTPDRLSPTILGTPRPAATRLALHPGPGAVIPPTGWPNACHLLTDGEIVSVLPQASRISRYAIPFTSDHDDPHGSTAPAGVCAYSFGLHGSVPDTARSVVTVTILAVADPSLIAQRYAQDLTQAQDKGTTGHQDVTDLGPAAGPEACYTYLQADTPAPAPPGAQAVVVCRQGPLMVDLSGYGAANFPGIVSLNAQRDHWRETVLLPLAALIAATVPREG